MYWSFSQYYCIYLLLCCSYKDTVSHCFSNPHLLLTARPLLILSSRLFMPSLLTSQSKLWALTQPSLRWYLFVTLGCQFLSEACFSPSTSFSSPGPLCLQLSWPLLYVWLISCFPSPHQSIWPLSRELIPSFSSLPTPQDTRWINGC